MEKKEGTEHLLEAAELHPFNTVKEHTNGVETVRISPLDSNQFMTASHDYSVCIWDLSRQAVVERHKLDAYGHVTQDRRHLVCYLLAGRQDDHPVAGAWRDRDVYWPDVERR